MEDVGIFQYFSPRHHAWSEVIVGRAVTVVDDFGGTHAGSRLEIVGTDAIATIEHVADVNTQLGEALSPGMAYRVVGQTGNIGHILAEGSQ